MGVAPVLSSEGAGVRSHVQPMGRKVLAVS